MRFHLFGLAHVPVARERCCGRMAALVWNMAKMLKRHGQEVVLYGSAGTDAPCDEFVEIVGPETLQTEHRPDDSSPAKWNWQQHADRPAWIEHRARGCLELKRRFRPGDVGLISCGAFQRFVAEECWAATEFIAGYPGVFHWSRVFPSAAWMHYQYGRLNQQSALQSWDAVVPHFLDPSDFPFDPERKPAGYLLFLGRLSQAEGVDLAMQIARASGLPLVVAGQAESGPAVPDWLSGLVAKMGNGVRLVGQVDHARRCELLAGAVALVNPVRHVEPFGMVNIEALAMGCPVIGPPFGSFPEILEPRVTGMLCRDLEEYVAAVDWAKGADRSACRAAAERRFSLDAVWPQYERHFQKIARVGTKAGWSVRGQWPRGVGEGGEALPPRPRPHQIEIEITTACNMACANCDRSAAQAPTDERMSLDQIRHFVEESRQLDWRWWKIALLGGEPTLHPDFLEIVRVLRELRPHWLVVATNGTNPDLIRQAGDVQVQPQTNPKEYDAFNHAPRDLGMNFSGMCWVSTRCGIGLSRNGYYLCGAAAGIDRVFGFGVGIPRLAEVDRVLEQVSLCNLCGHMHRRKAKDLPGMSKTWVEAYARYREHKPTLPLYGQQPRHAEHPAGALSAVNRMGSVSHDPSNPR